MGFKISSNAVTAAWAEVTMQAPQTCFPTIPSRNIDGCADMRNWLIEHGTRDGVYVPVTVMPAYSSLNKDKHAFHFRADLSDFTYDKNMLKNTSAKDAWSNAFIAIVEDLMFVLNEDTAKIYFHDHIKTSSILLVREEE